MFVILSKSQGIYAIKGNLLCKISFTCYYSNDFRENFINFFEAETEILFERVSIPMILKDKSTYSSSKEI